MIHDFNFDNDVKDSFSAATKKTLIVFPKMVANLEDLLSNYHKDNPAELVERSILPLDNLNVVNTSKLTAKLLEIFAWIIQREHACGPHRIGNLFRRIKSANEYHRRLALGIKTRDCVKCNKEQCLVG